MRPQPEPRVQALADARDADEVVITAMNEAGTLVYPTRLPEGRRRRQLQLRWDALAAGLLAGQIWPFASEVAQWYAELLWQPEQLAQLKATADAALFWTLDAVEWPQPDEVG